MLIPMSILFHNFKKVKMRENPEKDFFTVFLVKITFQRYPIAVNYVNYVKI